MSVDLSGLNRPQLEAAKATEGPVLVLAGAGSGKTRVITFRIAHLLDQGISPGRILAVSFTNKAAKEMQTRLVGLVGTPAQKVVASTFHALGVRFLREEFESAGLQQGFTVLDEADQLEAVRTAGRGLGYSPDQFDAKAVHGRISHFKNQLLVPNARDHPIDSLAARIYPAYEQRLRAMNAVDFDDLIGLPVRTMEQNAEVGHRWGRRFSYVMVDEYQDTNGAQLRLLKALVAGTGNLCVVGDDDQSIYGWRGAVANNILDFERQFPGTRTIALTQNYRSTNRILRCANAVIGNNTQRHSKELWSDLGDGDPVRSVRLETGDAEAAWIATDLLREKHLRTLAWNDFGILYRTNAQSRVLEDALRAARIPYRIVGGTRFYDRREVRQVVAYLRTIANPLDEAALRRIINFPARGIGDATIQRLGAVARERSVPLGRVIGDAGSVPGLKPQALRGLRALDLLLRGYRGRFARGPMGEACRSLIHEVGFANEIVRAHRDARQVERRVENLEEVASALGTFQQRQPDAKLVDYLSAFALDSRKEEDDDPTRDEVTLMTLHSAKGLEFPSVHLAGMEEGLLPHKRIVDGDGDLSEERRLAYVGITRARHWLTLTGAETRLRFGRIYRCKPSRFLLEIPAELLDGGHGGSPSSPSEKELKSRAKRAFDAMAELFE